VESKGLLSHFSDDFLPFQVDYLCDSHVIPTTDVKSSDSQENFSNEARFK
jgi:hypothetical protein